MKDTYTKDLVEEWFLCQGYKIEEETNWRIFYCPVCYKANFELTFYTKDGEFKLWKDSYRHKTHFTYEYLLSCSSIFHFKDPEVFEKLVEFMDHECSEHN